jgi:hypothetical protein
VHWFLRFVCVALPWLCRADGIEERRTLPALRVSAGAGAEGRVRLEWQIRGAGWSFVVQRRSALGEAWSDATPAILTNRWTDPETAGANFYRVIAVAPPTQRGRVIAAPRVGSLRQEQVQTLIDRAGSTLVARFDVSMFRMIYETIDPLGLPTQASGLLVVPEGDTAWPMLAYQHATALQRTNVPSRFNLEGFLGIFIASDGYLTVLPDYLGLGDSPGLHPYLHAASEASATVDMLRASRDLIATNGIAWNGQLFLTGYSQGGHATMAAHREIETFHTNEFTVTACAPMAGPYDLSGTLRSDFVGNRPIPNDYFYAYFMAAFREVYGWPENWSELFREPFAGAVSGVFDGRAGTEEVSAAYGGDLRAALQPAVLESLRNDPGHPLRRALAANDVFDWTPRAPVRFFHCAADRDVLPANTTVAMERFLSRGATNVSRADPDPEAGHVECAFPSTGAVRAWLETFRP